MPTDADNRILDRAVPVIAQTYPKPSEPRLHDLRVSSVGRVRGDRRRAVRETHSNVANGDRLPLLGEGDLARLLGPEADPHRQVHVGGNPTEPELPKAVRLDRQFAVHVLCPILAPEAELPPLHARRGAGEWTPVLRRTHPAQDNR